MASLGMSKLRLRRPASTETKTLARGPRAAITFSAVLVPLQAGSWLMSILAALGASPSNFTVPLMLAAVAGSIGVAGAAAGAAALGVAAGSLLSFLPQPARRTRPNEAAKPQTAIKVLFFMFLQYLSWNLIAQAK